MYLLFGGICVHFKKTDDKDASTKEKDALIEAKYILHHSPLIDLLWKRISWRAQADPFLEQEKLGGDPFDHLLYIVGERIGIPWTLSLHPDRRRTELFEKKVFERLQSKPQKIHAKFRILQEKRILSLPLPQAKELEGVLLYAYRDTVTELIRIAGAKRKTDLRRFVLNSIDDCRFLHPEMFLICDHEWLYDFLGDYLNRYLDAFMEDRINWNVESGVTQNAWKWPKQREFMLDCLYKYQEEFGDEFFFSPEAAGLPDEAKPIETLLVLVAQGAIAIGIDLNQRACRVDFRVSMLNQSGTSEIKLPKVTNFEFMGTITSNDKILSSKANPARNVHMKQGKQKYLWQYLRTTYGSDPQPRAIVEKYISQKMNRDITLTKKDFENLITTLSAYADCPKDDVRSAFIMGKTVGLKKIG